MNEQATWGDTAIRALEDIPPDYSVETDFYDVTRERIMSFAEQFDPQPMHIDEELAQETVFGELIGSGWQTLAITMRLLVDAGLLAPTPLIGAEFAHMRFHRPLRPGDKLRASAKVLGTRRSTSRPDRGFVELKVTTMNQDDACLVEQTWTLLVPTRATARLDED